MKWETENSLVIIPYTDYSWWKLLIIKVIWCCMVIFSSDSTCLYLGNMILNLYFQVKWYATFEITATNIKVLWELY